MPVWYVKENVIDRYSGSINQDFLEQLQTLAQYDTGQLITTTKHENNYVLGTNHAYSLLLTIKSKLQSLGESVDLFGAEQSPGNLKSILEGLNQSINDQELYPTFEDKIAHLFYFVIKDHPFVDGNKRAAVSLYFDYFQNNLLMTATKEGFSLGDNSFFSVDILSLALLTAQSNPEDKQTIVDLIIQLTQREFDRCLKNNKN